MTVYTRLYIVIFDQKDQHVINGVIFSQKDRHVINGVIFSQKYRHLTMVVI